MKTKKLLSKYFQSIFDGKIKKEKKFYLKLLKKSLKHKKTQRSD